MIAIVLVALLGVGATRVALMADDEDEDMMLFFGDDIELQREIALTKMESMDKPEFLILRTDANAIIFVRPDGDKFLISDDITDDSKDNGRSNPFFFKILFEDDEHPINVTNHFFTPSIDHNTHNNDINDDVNHTNHDDTSASSDNDVLPSFLTDIFPDLHDILYIPDHHSQSQHSRASDDSHMNGSSHPIDDSMNGSSHPIDDSMNGSSHPIDDNMNGASHANDDNMSGSSHSIDDNMNGSSHANDDYVNGASHSIDDNNMNGSSHPNDVIESQANAALDGTNASHSNDKSSSLTSPKKSNDDTTQSNDTPIESSSSNHCTDPITELHYPQKDTSIDNMSPVNTLSNDDSTPHDSSIDNSESTHHHHTASHQLDATHPFTSQQSQGSDDNEFQRIVKFFMCAAPAQDETPAKPRVIVHRRVLEDPSICCICFDNHHDSVFMDCGHGGVCFKCAIDTYVTNHALCPFCRSPIRQIVTLDMKEGFEDDQERKVYKVVGPTSSFLSALSVL